MQIIIDVQEKNPLQFSNVEGVEIVTASLDTGDYWCRHTNGSLDSTVIERKSVGDLFSSYTNEYEREKAKIMRAKGSGLRFVLAIEAPASEVRKGYSYQKGGVTIESKKTGIAMVRQVLTVQREYGIDVWWCADRRDMAFRIQEFYLAMERMMKRGRNEASPLPVAA